jgi:hypothetical protein
MEFGDPPTARRMLKGIKSRARYGPVGKGGSGLKAPKEQDDKGSPRVTGTSFGIDLYWLPLGAGATSCA